MRLLILLFLLTSCKTLDTTSNSHNYSAKTIKPVIIKKTPNYKIVEPIIIKPKIIKPNVKSY